MAIFLFYGDWWKPSYIINFGRVGIEDFLYSFFVTAIPFLAFYSFFNIKYQIDNEEIKKKINKLKNSNLKEIVIYSIKEFFYLKIFTIFVFITILSLFLFYLLGLNSFYTSLIAFSLVIIIFFKEFYEVRHILQFLILKALFASFVSSVVHVIGYLITVFVLKEGWIKNAWILENISFKVLMPNNTLVPLDDFIWFFIYSSLISIIPELLLKPSKVVIE